MSLKEIDDRIEPDEDSYESNDDLLIHFEKQYGLKFVFDAAAQDYNKKCLFYTNNALFDEWFVKELLENTNTVWCNPPHSLNEEFIKRADAQHKKHNITICMIVPANCQSMPTWHELIESETQTITENHPIKGRPNFLKLGRKTKFPSRNAYRVIIWRKV